MRLFVLCLALTGVLACGGSQKGETTPAEEPAAAPADPANPCGTNPCDPNKTPEETPVE